ncbi:hypothetical protein D3C72_880600 [compost metagenome]
MVGIPGLIVLNGGGVAVEVRADPRIGQMTGPRQHGARLIEDVMAVQRLPADLGRGRARRIDAIERHLFVVAARQQIHRADARSDDAEVLHQLQPVQPDGGEAVRGRGLRIDVVAIRQGQVARMARTGQIGRRPQGAPVRRGDVRPGDKPHRPGLRPRRQHGRHGPDPALRAIGLNRTGVVRAARAQKLKVRAGRDHGPRIHRHIAVQCNVAGEDVHRRPCRNDRRRDAARAPQGRRNDRARAPVGVGANKLADVDDIALSVDRCRPGFKGRLTGPNVHRNSPRPAARGGQVRGDKAERDVDAGADRGEVADLDVEVEHCGRSRTAGNGGHTAGRVANQGVLRVQNHRLALRPSQTGDQNRAAARDDVARPQLGRRRQLQQRRQGRVLGPGRRL